MPSARRAIRTIPSSPVAPSPPPARDTAGQTKAAAEESATPALLELRLVGSGKDLPEVPATTGPKLRLSRDAIVAAKDVASAYAKGKTVFVKLTPAASAAFEKATGDHRGERLAIVVRGTVAQAPEIKAAIAGGHISVDMPSDEDASALAQELSSPH